jgi:hypothetical protein
MKTLLSILLILMGMSAAGAQGVPIFGNTYNPSSTNSERGATNVVMTDANCVIATQTGCTVTNAATGAFDPSSPYTGTLVITSSVSLTATRTVTVPIGPGRTFSVYNLTTGSQSTTITAGGAAVTVTNTTGSPAFTVINAKDGTNFYAAPSGGVTSIIPGSNITCTPNSGGACAGTVTINNPVGGSLFTGPQALYYAYADGSGTTLTDQSGHGRNCTFAGGSAAPVWNPLGNGLVFNPNLNSGSAQFVTCPAGVLSGAATIELWFAPVTPLYDDGTVTTAGEEFILSDDAGSGIVTIPSRFGEIALWNAQEGVEPIDRYQGNTAYALTCPGTAYINGHAVLGYFNSGPTCPTWSTSGTVSIGTYTPGGGDFGMSMQLYAMAIYPFALTPSQISQNDSYVKTLLYAHGVSGFIDAKYPSLNIYQGDSRTVNYPSQQLTTSRPWLSSKLEPGREQYYNFGVAGRQLSAIIAAIPSVELPVLAANSTSSEPILLDAGTNDIQFGALTGAATYAEVQNYCATIHANAPGTKITYATSLPRFDWSSPGTQEPYRETLNSTVIAAMIAGTFNCDGVDDIANDPIAATQTTPNSFNPSGSPTYNSTWYVDGIHESPALIAEMSTGESIALLAVEGRLNTCKVIEKQIPYQVFVQANTASPSTAQTIPLMQLFPGWQICSLGAQVTTPFAGSGISAATISFGDSTGTSTQYLNAQSLLSTTMQAMGPQAYSSANGVVQMNVAATGGNLSAMTAGSMNVQIGVIQNPPTGSGPVYSPGLTNPMTTLGDTIYGGSSGVATRLAGNTTTARQFFSSTGTGSAAQAVGLGALISGDITAGLGYTPVQQGTGIGQATNAIKIGWSSGSRLLATVDTTNLGPIATDASLGSIPPAIGTGTPNTGTFTTVTATTLTDGTCTIGTSGLMQNCHGGGGFTALTAGTSDNSVNVATTAFVHNVVSGSGTTLANVAAGTAPASSGVYNFNNNTVAASNVNSASFITPATGTATSGANFNSGCYGANGSYWTGSTSNTDNWTWCPSLSGGANPTSTMTFSHTGSSGGAIFSVPSLQAANVTTTGLMQAGLLATVGNCASSASPAVCGASAAGAVAIAAGTNSVTINTSAVTASSNIFIQPDASISSLGITCNSTLSALVQPVITSRSAGVGFTITTAGTLLTNAGCYSYFIIN